MNVEKGEQGVIKRFSPEWWRMKNQIEGAQLRESKEARVAETAGKARQENKSNSKQTN